MDQINVDALTKKSADWATYVKTLAENPAIAATYHVEYDKNGNPIGGLPQIPPVVDIPLAILCITADLYLITFRRII